MAAAAGPDLLRAQYLGPEGVRRSPISTSTLTPVAPERERQRRDLERLVLQFHSVTELVRRTGAVRDRNGIFWEIAAGVQAELSYERVAVWQWQPADRSFVGVHGVGIADELVQAIKVPIEPVLPMLEVAIHRGRMARLPASASETLAAEVYAGLAEGPTECILAPLQSRGRNRCFRMRPDPQGCAKAEAGPDDGLSIVMDREQILGSCLPCPVFPIAGFLWADRGRTGKTVEEDLLPLWFYLSQTDLLLEAATLSEDLREAAIRDSLTGVHNRAYFFQALETEIERACRYGHQSAVVMIDIDGFTEANRSRGSVSGDRMLRRLAGVLRDSVRRIDLVARYGNDEFALLLPHTGTAEARAIVDRLRMRVEETAAAEPPADAGMTFSAGIAIAPRDAPEAEALMGQADYALHRARERGPGRTDCFGE